MKLMLAALLAAVQLSAQSPQVTALLNSAVTDFQANGPSPLVDARHIRAGRYGAASGNPHLLICGEVLPAGASATDGWVAFATIKTSGYEQWLGSGADTYCKSADTTFYPGIDLTADMKRGLGVK